MSGAAKFFLSMAILPSFVFSGSAQQIANSTLGTRSVMVNVIDARGNAIRDLTKENFRVRLNGKPAAVLDARYSLAPRRIVVLLDTSGSMTGQEGGKWQIALEAVDDLLSQAPKNVPIALITFAGSVRDVFDFPQGRTAIANWLKEGQVQQANLKHPAKTALFDAILDGLRFLGTIHTGDVIYTITDGGDNASHASAGQARAALLHSGVRLFAFLFAEPLRIPNEHESKDSFLKMVEDSGGFAFGVAGRQKTFRASWDVSFANDESNREKVKVYTEALDIQVNGFWTLEIAANSSTESKMRLDVVGRDGKKDFRVTYPRIIPAGK